MLYSFEIKTIIIKKGAEDDLPLNGNCNYYETRPSSRYYCDCDLAESIIYKLITVIPFVCDIK